MGDIYAFIRKMTNHELISARDAKALTDAVDGLIDEIDSRQMRINELHLQLGVANEAKSVLEAELAALREGREQQQAVAWPVECATEGCDSPASIYFVCGGIGSYYCASCYLKVQAIPHSPSEQAVTEADKSDDAVAELFVAAWAEADKAMRKFPQPNYVISKVAEEAGEVVKAAIHCAEGRETPANVIAEIRQTMAMLLRLYVEGDQVHGLPPLKAAMEAGR